MSVSNAAMWLLGSEGDFAVKEAPYSPRGPNDVVVRNVAVTINPMDWQIQDVGRNFREIFEVGEGVTTYKKGDRVMAKAHWISIPDPKYGAFQNYAICDAMTIALLPDHISLRRVVSFL
ncbi:hypothetical protein MW887_000705 [Aspergillus wentii]|nr:hypothetical protein MW887_000705 [Aspergillus wentii]